MKTRYLLMTILCLLLCLLLTGCGHKATKDELINYAKEKFGNFDVVRFEDSEKYSQLFLKDKEYSFEYYIKSSMQDFSIDGSSFGEYESKTSDFYSKYFNCILEKGKSELEQIKQEYNCYFVYPDSINYATSFSNDVILTIRYSSNISNCETIVTKVAQIIKKYDTRNLFNKSFLYGIYDGEYEKFMGEYSFSDNKYINKVEWLLNEAKHSMKYDMDIEFEIFSTLTFENYVEMDVHNIPGLSNGVTSYRANKPMGVSDTSESLKHVDVVYFKYNGEKYIVADCLKNYHLYVYKLEE